MGYPNRPSLIIILLALPIVTFSQEVGVLLKRHAEAMGGLERWQNLQSYRQVFTKQNGSQLTMTCRMPDEITLDFQKGDKKSTEVNVRRYTQITADSARKISVLICVHLWIKTIARQDTVHQWQFSAPPGGIYHYVIKSGGTLLDVGIILKQ